MNKLSLQKFDIFLTLLFIVGITIAVMAVALFLIQEFSIPVWAEEEKSTRDRINELKSERVKLQQELNNIPLLIEENEKRQSALAVLRDRYQEDLEELKQLKDDSFASIENIDDKEQQIFEIKNDINVLKDDKIELLNEISRIKEEINELDKTLKQSIPKPSRVQAIGIVLSNACLLQNNNPIENPNISHCPSYEDMISLDNSNPIVTGTFGMKDGNLQRLEDGNYINSWRWYDLDEYLIFVDPPANYYPSLKMIFIEQDLTAYTDFLQLEKADHTRVLSHDRFVNTSCREATIKADDWKKIIPDTIVYMRHNCDDAFTNIETVEVIHDSFVEHDITTSQKWILNNFQEEVIQDCSKSYGDCDVKSPWAN